MRTNVRPSWAKPLRLFYPETRPATGAAHSYGNDALYTTLRRADSARNGFTQIDRGKLVTGPDRAPATFYGGTLLATLRYSRLLLKVGEALRSGAGTDSYQIASSARPENALEPAGLAIHTVTDATPEHHDAFERHPRGACGLDLL
jgi:hypothetical protein